MRHYSSLNDSYNAGQDTNQAEAQIAEEALDVTEMEGCLSRLNFCLRRQAS